MQLANEQEKLLPLLPLAIRISARCFQNDKHWEGKGIHDVDKQPVCCRKARWHKQCAERVCIVVVFLFGWGANEWNEEEGEYHLWPWHNGFLF